MKLKSIIKLGRYKDTETGKEYNIFKGSRVGRSTTAYYYLYRNSRIIINDVDFHKNFVKVN